MTDFKPDPAPIHEQIKYGNFIVYAIIIFLGVFFIWRIDSIQKDVNLKLEYMGAKMELNMSNKDDKPSVKGESTPSGILRDSIKVKISTSSASLRGSDKL